MKRVLRSAAETSHMGVIALVLLASCASTSTSTLTENTSVTQTLLSSQQFGRFQDAVAISVDQFGNTYVVDRAGPSVIKYNEAGDSLGVISGFGREQYQFDGPQDVDARLTNTIFIADHNNDRVERYTKDFAYSATIKRTEAKSGEPYFVDPLEVATDDAGNIYILDGYNKHIVRVKPDLSFDRVIGAYTNTSTPGGALVNPTHITVDGYENLIAFDRSTSSLIVYDNLGNLKKRRSLADDESNSSIRSLAARGDTVFVLYSSKYKNWLRLFHTGTLTSLGAWELWVSVDPQRSSLSTALIDLDVRNGVTVLGRDQVYRANLSMQMEEIPTKK